MGVVIGGQTLMTSTIEEKSSRVVEVLLAAVSPFELMAGNLLGQPASDTPPPVWQPLLTILIGLATALGCVWFGAKISRWGC